MDFSGKWKPGGITPTTVAGSSPIVSWRPTIPRSDAEPATPNGWEGGAMTPAEDGRTYTLTITLDAAARIEYLIAYNDRFVAIRGTH
jgi:hypothetical protein